MAIPVRGDAHSPAPMKSEANVSWHSFSRRRSMHACLWHARAFVRAGARSHGASATSERLCDWVPVPQDLEHADHADQGDVWHDPLVLLPVANTNSGTKISARMERSVWLQALALGVVAHTTAWPSLSRSG